MCFFSFIIFQELKHLLKSPQYNERLLINNFGIHVPISKPIYSAWAGASLFGATDAIGTRSFSRESYLKENAIPDWSNLRFNSIYCDERQGWNSVSGWSHIWNIIIFFWTDFNLMLSAVSQHQRRNYSRVQLTNYWIICTLRIWFDRCV